MSDVAETLETLKANFVTRRKHLKGSIAEVEKQIKLVDYLLKLQDRIEKLEKENGNLQHRNDQLEAELRDKERSA